MIQLYPSAAGSHRDDKTSLSTKANPVMAIFARAESQCLDIPLLLSRAQPMRGGLGGPCDYE